MPPRSQDTPWCRPAYSLSSKTRDRGSLTRYGQCPRTWWIWASHRHRRAGLPGRHLGQCLPYVDRRQLAKLPGADNLQNRLKDVLTLIDNLRAAACGAVGSNVYLKPSHRRLELVNSFGPDSTCRRRQLVASTRYEKTRRSPRRLGRIATASGCSAAIGGSL